MAGWVWHAGPMDTFGARAEAAARLDGKFDVRVLEPSPPAVTQPPFADDAVAGGDVVPLERPDARSWASLCEEDPSLAGWCGDRWLAGWHRLEPVSGSFVATRESLHALAEHVVAPARHQANGKIGLRFTRGGFGTPWFGEDRQVRIDDGELVVCEGADTQRTPVTTLADAARSAGIGSSGAPTDVYTPSTSLAVDEALDIDTAAAHALGEWYGFCASVLEQVRSESAGASLVQLWPEHFDLAVDLGDEAAGQRANFGGSPGDAGHSEPYLYVGSWVSQEGEFWNEPWGASLSYQELLAADDQRGRALDFLRKGRDLLANG
ncbi:MAG: hypothetical protein QOE15_3321 [Acidimicrobiaceae bacterium]|nr:hypothetical protein [Acidimicrobiaceae bacterium]